MPDYSIKKIDNGWLLVKGETGNATFFSTVSALAEGLKELLGPNLAK